MTRNRLSEPKLVPPPPPSVAYAGAEARGRLRRWKTDLFQQCLAVDRLLETDELTSVAVDFARRGSAKGRRRAFAKLVKMLSVADVVLEWQRCDGPKPMAIWSMLRPQGSLFVDAEPESGLAQDIVAVDFLVAGAHPTYPKGVGYGISAGPWTLSVPDHCLGRCNERSGGLPGGIIRAAHNHVLRLRMRQIPSEPQTFLLRAGEGAFVSEMISGKFDDDGGFHYSIFARTWIGDDQLHDDQIVLAELAADGEPDDRLGNGLLLPKPLRRFVDDDDGFGCFAAIRLLR